MNKLFLVVTIVLAGLLSTSAPTKAQSSPAFKIIVNGKNPVASLSRAEVGKIFLKKTTSWPGEGSISPVDQTLGASSRESFSRSVHGKSAKAIKQYWTQQIYSGRAVPPPELSGDAKVVAFVNFPVFGSMSKTTSLSKTFVVGVVSG